MKWLKTRSLRGRYVRLLTIGIIVMLVINTAIYAFVNIQQDRLEQDYFSLQEKKDIFNELSLSLNNIFFRARGYYSFQNEQELQMAYGELANFKITLNRALQQSLDTNEETVLQNLQTFMDAYENENLPRAIELVQQGDYAGLREFSQSGLNTAVNEFNQYTTELDDNLEIQLESLRDQIFRFNHIYSLLVYASLTLILSALALYIWQTIRGIVRPIESLSVAVNDFTEGRLQDYEPIERGDEIGNLSRTFSSMFQAIRLNEAELKNRNRQLTDQQQEMLISQQKLQHSLLETETARARIERFNELNRQISAAVARQDVAERTIRYFGSAYGVDHGVMWFSEEEEYGVYQMTEAMMDQFTNERKAYIETRLEEQHCVIVTRSAEYAGGIVPFETPVYELYIRVDNGQTQQAIYVALARIENRFSEEEQQDIQNMLMRLHVVLDRIRLFEENVHERILNENIVNNISEGIQYVDETGSIIQRNEAFCNLFGTKPDGLEQVIPQAFWVSNLTSRVVEKEQFAQFFHNSLGEERNNSQSMTYTIDTTPQKVIEVYSTPIYNQTDYTGTVFVHRDITQQYEVDQMKTELVSTVSHELRTPLSSILGFTELLLYKDNKPEKQKRYLETIQKETSRLTHLINDFLDVQRMESGQQVYHFEKHAMEEVVLESIETFAIDEQRPITFIDYSTNSTVRIDKQRMMQTIVNLLSNAQKFSPEGGTIAIQMETDHNQLKMSIKDQGIGIAEHEIPKLFKKFSRIDNSSSRKIGGTGLGLAISKEIIMEHQGTIWIESEEGQGTTVWVTLPLVEEWKTHDTSRPDKASPLVLLVEDDISMLTLMSEELKHHGYRIMYATTSKEAQTAIATEVPDIVILDLILQDETTGWQLVEYLKENQLTAHIPVVISSALESQKSMVDTLQVADYLVKPYPLERLSQTVYMLLQK